MPTLYVNFIKLAFKQSTHILFKLPIKTANKINHLLAGLYSSYSY